MTTDKTAVRKVTRKRGAKAQKAPLKSRTISNDLIPIEEETWLLQPIAVTMMRHDYSLIQVRILVSIVESLQSILHGILNNSEAFNLTYSTRMSWMRMDVCLSSYLSRN